MLLKCSMNGTNGLVLRERASLTRDNAFPLVGDNDRQLLRPEAVSCGVLSFLSLLRSAYIRSPINFNETVY